MANNTVTISGMFGKDKTYFVGSPVVIDISGLEWPVASPFNIVRVEVLVPKAGTEPVEYSTVGSFCADTGGATSISFDISSALRAIWSMYDYSGEVTAAQAALAATGAAGQEYERATGKYFLRIYTEYMSDDDNVFTITECEDKDGNTLIEGGCSITGGLTEWERYTIGAPENADVSHWEHTGVWYGDASTKPTSQPERVGKDSITSWVDVKQGYTKSIFYPAPTAAQLPASTGDADDTAGSTEGWTGHAPVVLRDSIEYTDFLFVNRRGAVETCSAMMQESMDINIESQNYSLIERPAFKPKRSVMAMTSGGRKSWAMSSGLTTREWAEWWTEDFLKSERHWMRYRQGDVDMYVPVVVEPKKSNNIYDRAKQQMPHIDFTVTLAVEG